MSERTHRVDTLFGSMYSELEEQRNARGVCGADTDGKRWHVVLSTVHVPGVVCRRRFKARALKIFGGCVASAASAVTRTRTRRTRGRGVIFSSGYTTRRRALRRDDLMCAWR